MFDVVRSRWNHFVGRTSRAEELLASMNDASAVHVVYRHRRLSCDFPSQIRTQSSATRCSPGRVRHGKDTGTSKRGYQEEVGAVRPL